MKNMIITKSIIMMIMVLLLLTIMLIIAHLGPRHELTLIALNNLALLLQVDPTFEVPVKRGPDGSAGFMIKQSNLSISEVKEQEEGGTAWSSLEQLRVGDVVKAVNGQAIANVGEYRRLV